ncbi:MAG: hypothetical protein AAGC85_23760 [Bacteroidota bacterium]
MEGIIYDITAHLLQDFKKDIYQILLTGSQLSPKEIDFWSDADLGIILNTWEEFDLSKCLQSLSNCYPIIAQETHLATESIIICLVMRTSKGLAFLDISFYSIRKWEDVWPTRMSPFKVLYGSPLPEKKEAQKPSVTTFTYSQEKISHTWFLFFQTMKKFKRRDNLIGLHLMLELVKEYLVIEMIERDVAKETNIHRFGSNEQLPASISSLELPFSTINQNLDYLLKLANEFDQKWQQYFPDYQSRLSVFEQYVADSIDKLSP